MHLYWFLKYLHIIGAAVLLGTGAGIAFFMLLGHRTGQPATVAAIARIVDRKRARAGSDHHAVSTAAGTTNVVGGGDGEIEGVRR